MQTRGYATEHARQPVVGVRSGVVLSPPSGPGKEFVGFPPPSIEHAAVGGQDAAEVRIRLERRHEAVQPEGDDARADPGKPSVLTTPCQTSHAPPISASAATTNNTIDRSTVTRAKLTVRPVLPDIPDCHPVFISWSMTPPRLCITLR
jgi:hypothetical protein